MSVSPPKKFGGEEEEGEGLSASPSPQPPPQILPPPPKFLPPQDEAEPGARTAGPPPGERADSNPQHAPRWGRAAGHGASARGTLGAVVLKKSLAGEPGGFAGGLFWGTRGEGAGVWGSSPPLTPCPVPPQSPYGGRGKNPAPPCPGGFWGALGGGGGVSVGSPIHYFDPPSPRMKSAVPAAPSEPHTELDLERFKLVPVWGGLGEGENLGRGFMGCVPPLTLCPPPPPRSCWRRCGGSCRR